MSLAVGQAAECRRRFDAGDVEAYTALAGRGGPPGTVPEPLIGALYSRLLGVDLPGRGTNYLKQETTFVRPVSVGETLTARVEITRLRPEKHLVDLRTTCRDEAGELVSDGRALVYVEDVSA